MNRRWTDSTFAIFSSKGFQTTELNSRIGRTKTQKALVSKTRDWKHLSISEALATTLSTWGENLSLLLYVITRSVIQSATGSLVWPIWQTNWLILGHWTLELMYMTLHLDGDFLARQAFSMWQPRSWISKIRQIYM